MTPIVPPTVFAAPIPASATSDATQTQLNNLVAQINKNLIRDSAVFYRLANFIWKNPQNKTPQQIFTYLGTSAASLVALCNAWVGFVQAYTGQQIPVVPQGWTITSNPDGTVTVAQK